MSKATTHEGVRRMRFVSLLDRQERGEITQEEAAEMLGTSVRTFQRWSERYREEGEDGLNDRRIGKRSPRRVPEAEIERMLGSFATSTRTSRSSTSTRSWWRAITTSSATR